MLGVLGVLVVVPCVSWVPCVLGTGCSASDPGLDPGSSRVDDGGGDGESQVLYLMTSFIHLLTLFTFVHA